MSKELIQHKESYARTVDPEACPFCKELPIQTFSNFVILPNVSPYAEDHIMLLPKRHLHSELDFNPEEKLELQNIHIRILQRYYDMFGSAMYLSRESTQDQSQWHWHRQYMSSDTWCKVKRIEYKPIEFQI